MNVPIAPEVGLYLDECFFSSYNKKWESSHEEVSMKAYMKEAEDFKLKYIYSHIASAERNDGVVALWLHSLNNYNHQDLRGIEGASTADVSGNVVAEECPSSSEKNTEIEDMDE